MLEKFLNITKKELFEKANIWEYKRKYLWRSKKSIDDFYLNMPDEYLCKLHTEFLKNKDEYLKGVKIYDGMKVLDFGCGLGDYGYEFVKAGANVTFFDINEHKGIKYLKWRLESDKLNAKIIFDEQSLENDYDLILALDVFEHIPNSAEKFKMLYEKTAMYGNMLITSPLIYPIVYNYPDEIIFNFADGEHIQEAISDWYGCKVNNFIRNNMIRSDENPYLFKKSFLRILLLFALNPMFPYGVALNYYKAFKKIAKVFLPNQLNIKFTGENMKEAIDENKINMLFQIDSAIWFNIPKNISIPKLAYSVDTFINTKRIMEKLKQFDYKFFAQKKFVKNKNEYWLPLAFDPEVYKPLNVYDSNKYTIAFCGTVLNTKLHSERNKYLKYLLNNFDIYIGRDYEENANLKYNQSIFIFNYGIANDLNMRVFEAMATGRVLLMNRVDGINDFFNADEDYIQYETEEELGRKIRECLSEPQKYDSIRESALKKIKNHTYTDRIKKILEIIKNT